MVVGRSRTATRSHVLSCGAGCLMTRGVGARPSPTNASKRQRPLRPTSMSLLPSLVAKFCSNPEPPLSVSVTPTLWGARGARSLSGTGWRMGQRRAGRLWRMGVGARRGSTVVFLALIHDHSLSCPCCHAWKSRFYRWQASLGFFVSRPPPSASPSRRDSTRKFWLRTSHIYHCCKREALQRSQRTPCARF